MKNKKGSKMNLIKDRTDKGRCPICNEKLGTDFKVVEYLGKKIWVHKKHYIVGEKK